MSKVPRPSYNKKILANWNELQEFPPCLQSLADHHEIVKSQPKTEE